MRRLREDLARHQIRVFPWPLSEDDAEDEAAKADVQDRLPFAVVGATDEATVNGQYVRGRQVGLSPPPPLLLAAPSLPLIHTWITSIAAVLMKFRSWWSMACRLCG